jgi:hypothetical protein
MPVAAAPLADVLVRDLDPAVAVGGDDHRLHQPPVRLLDLAPAVELRLRLAQSHGEAVADALEGSGVEDPRAAHRAHRPFDPLARERRREELAEALLEQADLVTEVLADAALREETGLREGIANDLHGIDRPIGRLDLKQLAGHETLLPPKSTTGPF